MPATRHLIIGRDGGLGSALSAALRREGHQLLSTTRRASDGQQEGLRHLDLAEDLSDWTPPPEVGTAFLCAAVSAVAECRLHPARARRVNVDNTVLVAERLTRAGAFVVFPSTNLVFDGALPFRLVTDRPSPRSEYGRQKAEAESRLLTLGGSVAVVRLSKILAPGAVLMAGWARQLLDGRPIAPFQDMVMAPVPLSFTVKALLAIAHVRGGGLWQLSAAEDISYAEAAVRLCRRLGADESLVRPVSWRSACPDMEHVPAHTTLDVSRLAKDLNMAPPSVDAALGEALGEIW